MQVDFLKNAALATKCLVFFRQSCVKQCGPRIALRSLNFSAMDTKHIDDFLGFLRAIGLPVDERPTSGDIVLERIDIDRSALVVH